MNTPSPLVPQGAIPPKTTSRPQRVLMIAAMVVGLHVAGLSLVLFQGCGKDSGAKTAANTAGIDTNSAAALGYPAPDTNPTPSMFASATNGAGTNFAHANTNLAPAPTPGSPIGGPLPGVPGAGAVAENLPVPPVPADQTAAAPAGPEKDYKVQKGDTLTSIASKNGITVGALMKSNPNLDPKKLKVGQPLKVPAPVAGATASRSLAGTASVPPTSSNGATAGAATGGAAGTYKVKPGDTLTKIARSHGITVAQLRAANNMKTTQVQVGKVLKIPAPQKTAAVPTTTNTTQH
jgi:LysM repeat protein